MHLLVPRCLIFTANLFDGGRGLFVIPSRDGITRRNHMVIIIVNFKTNYQNEEKMN